MKAKIFTGIILAVYVIYLIAFFGSVLRLWQTGQAIAIGLGAAILVVPLIGVWILIREITFGATTEAMAKELEEQGLLPHDDLPRMPSGRIVKEAADEDFKKYAAEAEDYPEKWQSWHRLALAYDAAGDRRRARDSMRTAISLRKQARNGTDR